MSASVSRMQMSFAMQRWSEPVPRRILNLPFPEMIAVGGNLVDDLVFFSKCLVMPGTGSTVEIQAVFVLFLEVLRVEGGRMLTYRQCVDAIALLPPDVLLPRLRAVREMPAEEAVRFVSTAAMRTALLSRPWSRMALALRSARMRLCEDREFWTVEGVRYRYLERGVRVFFGTYPELFERLDLRRPSL